MRVYSVTDVGQIRQINQDYIFASEQPVGNLPNLFVVADGMGGHNAGDFASKCAVNTMLEAVREDSEFNPIKIMRKGIEAANKKLLEAAAEDASLKGMGTTIVAATVVGNYAYVANVGDSRLYILSDELQQVTIDHSLVGEMIRMGELSREEARTHPDRNIITRALGAGEGIEADYFDVKLDEACRLILCSDGLYSMVSDSEIYEILKDSGEDKDPARELMNKANENGGRDNIAVIVAEPFNKEVREC